MRGLALDGILGAHCDAAGVRLSVERHTTRVSLALGDDCTADVIVVTFLAAKAGLATIVGAGP